MVADTLPGHIVALGDVAFRHLAGLVAYNEADVAYEPVSQLEVVGERADDALLVVVAKALRVLEAVDCGLKALDVERGVELMQIRAGEPSISM